MKPLKPIMLLLVLAAGSTVMQAKPKKPAKLPAVFDQARYVYVEAVDGQQFDPRLMPEDQRAIADVDEAVADWPRYVLVTSRDKADLIFMVRKGRLATTTVGIGSAQPFPPSQRGNGPGTSGRSVGADAGPPDDLLEVYQPTSGDSRGMLLWMRTLEGGLDAPDLPLLQQLRDEVERSYPPKPQKP